MTNDKGDPNRRETRSSAHLLPKDLLTPTELSSLSKDSKLLFTALEKSFSSHIKQLTDHYDALLSRREEEIQSLTTKVENLESQNVNLLKKIENLTQEIDETAQYQRRDTLIFSGNVVPHEVTQENSTQVIVDAVRNHLNIPFSVDDVSVAHRLGKKRDGVSRPIIVKLISRTKKSQIVQARIAKNASSTNTNQRPVMHVNESLTPTRRTLFYKVRQLRKKHPTLFKQLYTQDGRITIKLTATNDRKYFITNENELLKFLEVSPLLQDAYAALLATA